MASRALSLRTPPMAMSFFSGSFLIGIKAAMPLLAWLDLANIAIDRKSVV